MSTPKQLLVSKRKLFLAIISIALICSLASGSIMYVVAQGGSTPITISSGIYPGAPSHMIWVDSGIYYDKTSYGVTTSSTNAATLINNVITSNSYILIASGTYILTSPINLIGKNTVRISGYNTQGVGSSEGTVLKVGDGANCDVISKIEIGGTQAALFIEHLTIYVNKATQTSGNGINMQNCEDVTIQNCEIYQCYENGVKSLYGDRLTISHSNIMSNGGRGIYRSGSATTIQDCRLASNMLDGIYLYGAYKGTRILDCDIDTNVNGITLYGGLIGAIIENNNIHESTSTDVVIYGSAGVGNNGTIISNNVFYSGHDYGIQIVDSGVGSLNTKIMGNTFNDYTLAIYSVTHSEDTVIVYNTFLNCITQYNLVDSSYITVGNSPLQETAIHSVYVPFISGTELYQYANAPMYRIDADTDYASTNIDLGRNIQNLQIFVTWISFSTSTLTFNVTCDFRLSTDYFVAANERTINISQAVTSAYNYRSNVTSLWTDLLVYHPYSYWVDGLSITLKVQRTVGQSMNGGFFGVLVEYS
jgi:hypothetical protein